MRYRTKGSFVDNVSHTRSVDCTGEHNYTFPVYSTGETVSTLDVVTPNFRKRIASGEILMNPFTRVRQTGISVAGSACSVRATAATNCGNGQYMNTTISWSSNHADRFYNRAIGGSTWTCTTQCILNPIQLISDVDKMHLISEAATRCRSERGRSDQNSWEALAESDKALEALTGVFKSSAKALRSFKKGDFLAFQRNAAEGYLVWRYGLKPLISDVNGIISGWSKALGKRRKTTRVSEKIQKSAVNTVQWNDSTIFTVFQQNLEDKINVRVTSIDDMTVSRLVAIGLSSKDLITLPWELVRYSFVVDWFVNVGDFIGSLVPAFEATQLGACTVIKRELCHSYNVVSSGSSSPSYITTGTFGGGYISTIDSVERSVGIPAPKLLIKTDFKFNRLVRCLDAYALLSQRFR